MFCSIRFSLVLCVSSVLWHCWLGHLTCKNPSPIWPIMCLVGYWVLINQWWFQNFDWKLRNSCSCACTVNKVLSCRRETVLQGALVLAKSRRLELGDKWHHRCVFNHCHIIGLQTWQIRWKKQNKGYYVVQGYSRPSRLVPIESPYANSY